MYIKTSVNSEKIKWFIESVYRQKSFFLYCSGEQIVQRETRDSGENNEM